MQEAVLTAILTSYVWSLSFHDKLEGTVNVIEDPKDLVQPSNASNSGLTNRVCSPGARPETENSKGLSPAYINTKWKFMIHLRVWGGDYCTSV